MTSEEKNTLFGFLDLASGYCGSGYKREKVSIIESPDTNSSLRVPLAYSVEEPSEKNSESENPDCLETVLLDIAACKACALASTRTRVVPGEGPQNPLVVVIGEGPGADEDKAGRPFVGRAGQLLDKMLASIGLSRDKNCYIANMVKCRPPGNRDPGPEEIASCLPYLERQIALLRPKIILCAGRVAAQNLLKTTQGINALRGELSSLKIRETPGEMETSSELDIPVLCTFHPSALLRDESLKRPAWEDLKLLKSQIENRE